ncbi:MAG: hypothetical protein QNK37_13110 [Acidobacteriota bacterium]|nr:hypothetical protein [Acidobacteriota bacterium]
MTREEWIVIQPVLAAVIEGNLTQDQAMERVREQHSHLEETFRSLLHAWGATGSFMEKIPERLRLSITDEEEKD